MKKEYILYGILILIVLTQFGIGGVGYSHFKQNDKSLRDSINQIESYVLKLEAEKAYLMDSVQIHIQIEEILLDSLKIDQEKIHEIKKHFESRIIDIDKYSDSEYQNYLRTRISSPDRD